MNEVLVNFINLTDDQLIELKRAAEREIFYSYYKKNIKYIARMFILEFKINGYFALFNRLIRGMKLIVRVKKGLDMRERPTSI